MDHILIPTDFSEGSLTAVRFAFDAFGTAKTKYILLNTVGLIVSEPVVMSEMDVLRTNARKRLDAFEKQCRALKPGERIDLMSMVGAGDVMHAIQHVYTGEKVTAVVMGGRGEGMASLWGSNTEEVAKRSARPVIVVPPDWIPGPIERILYADDRAFVHKRKTLYMLTDLAKRYDAEIVMVHVRVRTDEPLQGSALAEQGSWFQSIKHSIITVAGDAVVDRLKQLIDSNEYGMVAVLHRDMHWLEGLFRRSVAKRMALHSKVPLLVLHE